MSATSKLWTITNHASITPKNPIFIEGLPGIGNVGKVVIDFLIEQSKAKLVSSFSSYSLPNSVFVTENNLVELPKISLFSASINNHDFLFMTGDVQPSDEHSSYIFCEEIIKHIMQWKTSSIITLGGIGLQESPLKPQVYCTGNDSDLIKKMEQAGANPNVYGVVGPIIGVSGLLVGLSKDRIPAAALLAETLGHPMYLGLRGAKEILSVLKELYGINFSTQEIDDEIQQIESESVDISKKNPKLDAVNKLKKYKDTNYIG